LTILGDDNELLHIYSTFVKSIFYFFSFSSMLFYSQKTFIFSFSAECIARRDWRHKRYSSYFSLYCKDLGLLSWNLVTNSYSFASSSVNTDSKPIGVINTINNADQKNLTICSQFCLAICDGLFVMDYLGYYL